MKRWPAKHMAEILVDTSALFALLNSEDDHHAKAARTHERLVRQKASLILPNFILAETHAILNKRVGPRAALDFLNAALRDFEMERVSLEDEWSAHAILQTATRARSLSYFDAILVAVAERRKISEIFSYDRHFELMGLRLSHS